MRSIKEMQENIRTSLDESFLEVDVQQSLKKRLDEDKSDKYDIPNKKQHTASLTI